MDCVQAEIDLFLGLWSIDLVFVWVVDIGLVCMRARKSLGFSVCIEIDLVFVWVVENGLISVWGIDPL